MCTTTFSISTILSIIGALTGVTSLLITFLIYKRSSFKLSIFTEPNLTFLWCTHPYWENEVSHVVLKWMRIVNNSDVPITIFEFEYAGMRAFSNTYTNDSLDESLASYEDNTYKLPITLDAYESIEGYFVFRGVGPLPKENKYKLKAYTSRKTKSLWSKLDYSESDL